ncbi:MAG: (Fe-S)-binding protein [Rhodospirillales bacterium]|nr:(Fe-S)-binding protein [Rhodospirillales bacterium]
MAQKEYDVPVLEDHLPTPHLQRDALAHVRSHPAKPELQKALGFPGELVEDWEAKAVAKLGELLQKHRSLRVYLDACVKCGACADKCQFFLGSGDPKNMPVARQDLLRQVYRKYFTAAGKIAPDLVGAKPLTREMLDEWYVYYHQCSQCRRCSLFCPYGIDTAEISMAAREVLDHIGMGQKYTNEVILKCHQLGNNLGLNPAALRNTVEGLEEDIMDDTGVPVRLPVDEVGADVLLVTPSADFFAEPQVDGLIGYAKVFHQAGLSWTLSSYASEAGNFGMFIGSYDHMQKLAVRIRKAALDLGVKRIIVGECGHAWRVAYSLLNTTSGPWDFLDPKYPHPQHICEYTWDLIQKGGLNLDATANDDKVVTFHDSCNPARAAGMGGYPGGQFDIPRNIIKTVCNKFVDMHPDTIREKTFCCGGGGGLLTEELMPVRIAGMKPRMQALKQVMDEKGVTHMAAICAICKSQFTGVMPRYGMDPYMIVSLHQLVNNAIQLGTKE